MYVRENREYYDNWSKLEKTGCNRQMNIFKTWKKYTIFELFE